MAAALRRSLKFFIPRSRFSTIASPFEPKPSSSSSSSSISGLASAIRAESDPDRILDLFNSSASQIPRFHSHRPIYRLAVQRLSRARRPDLVERLLDRQLSDPSAPKSEGFLLRLLSLYSLARLPDHAACALDAMRRQGCSPTEKSLCALLSAFLDSKQYKRVVDSFNSLPKELSITPGILSHNILLKALCEHGQLDAARRLLDEMPRKGVKPDIVSYNAVLNGYLKSKEDIKFEEVLKEILRQKLEPNVFTNNCRISVLCGKGKSYEAEELLDVMVSKGMQPNLVSFNTVIDQFCKEGDAGSALRVFKRMRVMKRVKGKDGVSPNADTYNVLIHILVETGEFGSAFEVCRECLTRKSAPPFEVVKGLVDGLLKNSKVDEANGIIEKMKSVLKGDAIDAWKKVEGALAL